MNTPPPLMRDQRAVDREHLGLLAIFHFVVAGLSIAGIGFLFLHYSLMHSIFDHPEVWQPKPNQPGAPIPPMPHMPKELLAMLKWFYLFGGISLVQIGRAHV